MPRARGPFHVNMAPQSMEEHEGIRISRLLLDKEFFGDLAATSKGEMLSAMTAVKGSAGYVAIERVTGILAGRQGSFVLQHSGTMNRGAATLVLTVVPDSGSGKLAGIAGAMSIEIADGKHSYDFDYSLPQLHDDD